MEYLFTGHMLSIFHQYSIMIPGDLVSNNMSHSIKYQVTWYQHSIMIPDDLVSTLHTLSIHIPATQIIRHIHSIPSFIDCFPSNKSIIFYCIPQEVSFLLYSRKTKQHYTGKNWRNTLDYPCSIAFRHSKIRGKKPHKPDNLRVSAERTAWEFVCP